MNTPCACHPCAPAQGYKTNVARLGRDGEIAARHWARAAIVASLSRASRRGLHLLGISSIRPVARCVSSGTLALLVAATLVALPTVARASAPADEPDEFAPVQVSDPLAPLNRAVFKFNDGLYAVVLRPVARGYERATPPPVQRGLTNFYDNLRFPIRFVGDVLAGRPKRAAQETGKFLVNTTAGFAGLVNVSDSVPALKDVPPGGLGTAFAAWGLGHGPYLVLPVLGPSSVRDGIGLAGDIWLIPTNWRAFERLDGYDWWWRTAIQTTDTVQSAPGFLKTYDAFLKSAVDPYLAVRNGYLQYRDAAVKK
jgi:phospholipid-binding lipoprotein MlaA